MKQVKVEGGRARDLLKRALYLAYLAAGGPRGMGVLQAARLNGATPSEDQVWQCIVRNEDYQGWPRGHDLREVYADYVFGSMVKWGATIVDPFILEIDSWDEPLRPDYQGFASKYPTTHALLDAAAKQLGIRYDLHGHEVAHALARILRPVKELGLIVKKAEHRGSGTFEFDIEDRTGAFVGHAAVGVTYHVVMTRWNGDGVCDVDDQKLLEWIKKGVSPAHVNQGAVGVEELIDLFDSEIPAVLVREALEKEKGA